MNLLLSTPHLQQVSSRVCQHRSYRTYYLYLPCLFSTLLAAPLSPTATPLTVLGTSALFFAGALIMRGAGCTINDLWDRNLDPHVARTRLRPIARGAISVQRAIPFLGLQLFSGLAILLQFPWQCFFYATPSLILVTLYPLAKRITQYPQFVLGLTFSWGAFMGFPALGTDILSNTGALASAACLYGSCIAWTLIYDMIYAYQDIRDDAKVGILSIARTHEANAKQFLMAVSAVQVGLLVGAGYFAQAGVAYYFLSCGGAAATLDYMIRQVKLDDVEDCASWFRRGAWLTGGVISAGLLLDYLMDYSGLYGNTNRKMIKAAERAVPIT
ncbi:Para-hydroxybenzoate--polyprenyltransferase, mitochondrial precursor (PHB:polyprenyltransferase) [Recurvomyces mirabilis]|uniref:4-hydroxybenzoate polyprenyltransferase, mitochondrial n=1 Tax=Recurvomyces mirabilis TaxID=574656 RepID=A0AAE0WLC2_9PEZI|nr:Para-hydroxybenzoate--polyprenyltransferase, mitochondrial precursor (PHB:polyprenyltransferase) [Recurvomyces mirabilis]KAK5152252.1 Para-hydroxybenzoate--polyprenyltransferase, mitochondrial precursor (PHB:polyprenyltransferase) [Recurvomyces mirabilis]